MFSVLQILSNDAMKPSKLHHHFCLNHNEQKLHVLETFYALLASHTGSETAVNSTLTLIF